MKATELLQKQHREIEQLLERLRTAGPESEGAIREELASLLVAHTQIEEQHFYPALRQAAPERVLEAIEEHGLADYELARDLGARSGEQIQTRTSVLAEVVLAHVQKEESELFRRAEEHLTNQELAEIGEVMLQTFEHVRRSNIKQILARALAENAPKLPGRVTQGKARSARRGAAKAQGKAATPRRRATTTAKRGTAKRGTSQRGTTKRGTSQRGTAKRGAAKQGTAQRGTAGKAQAGASTKRSARGTTAKRSATSARGGASQRGASGARKSTKSAGSTRSSARGSRAGARKSASR